MEASPRSCYNNAWMAYVLNALIADLGLLRGPLDLSVVSLPAGKGLVPLPRKYWGEAGCRSQPLLRAAEGRSAPDAEFDSPGERQEYIRHASASFAWISELCARLSSGPGAAVAYVEAEFFGGAGGQAAAVWEAGALVLGPLVDEAAINRALARIGVARSGFDDEFAVLQLHRCRMTDDWFKLV